MADVQISEVDAKPAPVSLGKSRVKFGSHCWATQESTVVQQWVSLFKPTAGYRNIGCVATFSWPMNIPNSVIHVTWIVRISIFSLINPIHYQNHLQ
jgi:hypothetical protein